MNKRPHKSIVEMDVSGEQKPTKKSIWNIHAHNIAESNQGIENTSLFLSFVFFFCVQ